MKNIAAVLAGSYRVERELGVGGMATVYLAEDLRHGRQVAIKLLHPELSAVLGPDRFLAEIKLTASLQHPHILPLFDSGSAEGLLYYVMPYVDGETLRSRLERERQLPVADAIRIAVEVADALEYAHKHGVIHRDIKPENILLRDGHALVADFGIALAVQQAGGQRITQTGMSLGTPHYMSPEQAMGEREVTARSDIYTLGAVTYEMLAGEPPFAGFTAQAIVARVMTEDPKPLTTQRRSVPVHVEQAVLTALEKLPADRFGSAAAFAAAITGASSGGTVVQRARNRPAVGRHALLGVALGAAVLAGAGGWFAGSRNREARGNEAPPSRLRLMAPSIGGSGAIGLHRQVTLTPDGSSVIFNTGGSAGSLSRQRGSLSRQRLDEERSTFVPGTSLSFAPSVSRDGKWIAARDVAGNLLLHSAAGLTHAARGRALTRGLAYYAWHPDGTLWVTSPPYRDLMRLRPGSDSLEVVLSGLDASLWLQQILPSGNTAIAVEAGIDVSSGSCVLFDLRSGERTTIVGTPVVAARYSAGHLVYAEPNGTLRAQAFDPATGRTAGASVTVATGIGITGSGDAQFDASLNGTIVYVPEEPQSLVLVDRLGVVRTVTEDRDNYHMPRFSPDGRKVSLDLVSAGGRDVWLLDPAQQTLTRTTFDRDGHDASWMPDGRWISYSSSRSGVLGIYRLRPGSVAPPESLLASSSLNFSGEWLADGSALLAVTTDSGPGGSQDVAIIRNGGRGPIEPLVATRFEESYPALSRDRNWIAFVSDQSGRDEVYVQPLSRGGGVVQVSRDGGGEPVWGKDGAEIFYRGMSGGVPMLIAARIEYTDGVRVTGRQALFPTAEYMTTTPHANYDVSPDGRTFVMVRRNPGGRLTVIQNLPALVALLSGGGIQ